MYVYGILLVYVCHIRHEVYLTGVNHPTDHRMITDYNPGMVKYYPGFQEQGLAPCTS